MKQGFAKVLCLGLLLGAAAAHADPEYVFPKYVPPDPAIVAQVSEFAHARLRLDLYLQTRLEQAQDSGELRLEEAQRLTAELKSAFADYSYGPASRNRIRTEYQPATATRAAAWLSSPLGRKIQALNAQARKPESEPELREFARALKAKPASPKRLALIKRLIGEYDQMASEERVTSVLGRTWINGMEQVETDIVQATVAQWGQTNGTLRLVDRGEVIYAFAGAFGDPDMKTLTEGQKVDVLVSRTTTTEKGDRVTERIWPAGSKHPGKENLDQLISKLKTWKWPDAAAWLITDQLFTYRTLTDAELAQYATFLETYTGRWVREQGWSTSDTLLSRAGYEAAVRLLDLDPARPPSREMRNLMQTALLESGERQLRDGNLERAEKFYREALATVHYEHPCERADAPGVGRLAELDVTC